MGISVILNWILLVCCLVNLGVGAEQAYQRIARDLHNQYRRKHHANPLAASDDLNNRAVRCAQYYADIGRIDHTCPYKNNAGENLSVLFAWGRPPTDSQLARTSSIEWYSEERGYNYNSNRFQQAKGHFTQMVWKNSRALGFGTGRKGNMIVGCALYSPPGNYHGQYTRNVGRP